MSDEDLIEPGRVGEITPFFSKEKPKEKTLEEHLEYAYSMKQQKEEAEKEYKLSMDRIKDLMKVDGVERKREILTAGDFNLIVMKRSGQVKIDWERYVVDTVGEPAMKELEALKALAKEGKADSKYITVGKEVVSCEIVRRTAQDYPF